MPGEDQVTVRGKGFGGRPRHRPKPFPVSLAVLHINSRDSKDVAEDSKDRAPWQQVWRLALRNAALGELVFLEVGGSSADSRRLGLSTCDLQLQDGPTVRWERAQGASHRPLLWIASPALDLSLLASMPGSQEPRRFCAISSMHVVPRGIRVEVVRQAAVEENRRFGV